MEILQVTHSYQVQFSHNHMNSNVARLNVGPCTSLQFLVKMFRLSGS